MSDVTKIKETLLESHELYDVWEETWYWGDDRDPQSSVMIMARNKGGDWMGEKDMAEHLAKRGIAAELMDEESDICCIGWSEREQKYFGWSHRTITGFGIGDMIFEEDFGDDDDVLFIKHGTRRIETKADARIAACNFAEYVG